MLSSENTVTGNDGTEALEVCASPVRRHNHRHNVKHRYDFIRTLGKGTYGKVKLARHKERNELVAVKAIKKDKIKDNEDLKHIRREIDIMSTIRHPHIIQIYEVFENQDRIVIVMEYAAGGELYDYLASKRGIAEEDSKSFFRQIVSAVSYCHKAGIVHRDLKLENILLSNENQIKIADFGLANKYKAESLLNTFCGSPLYASPEIVTGVPYVGPEVDSWSLGVLLYALVYGTMPFDGRNFQVLTRQITRGEISKPDRESDAHSLILWMLTVDPTKRATIDDVASHAWLNAVDDITTPVSVGNETSYVNYIDTTVNDNGWDNTKADDKAVDVDTCENNQPKGILKHNLVVVAKATAPPVEVPKVQPAPPASPDVILAGQLAAVCGLQAKDSLKLKGKPQGASTKRRVMRSRRDRESGYYSSPERAPVVNLTLSAPEHTYHAPNSVPQIKPSLTPSRMSQVRSNNPTLPPRTHAPSCGSREYLMPTPSPVDGRPVSISSDDGSSIGSQTRPASTYSDSSILSTDSFDLCMSNPPLPPPSAAYHPIAPQPQQRPLSLSLIPDTLPPMPESYVGDQPAPGALTPNSEKLVRGLERILAPNKRRHNRQSHVTSNDVSRHQQSLGDTSQLSTMMNQLNVDLELAYKKAFDICANLRSAEV
ncbi:unnamed protein product [Clavelina lepadiformis]|uniref:non-specific serine/threonine protein kinase n=1 Tax=Clavelina lepadiformis TaxID=159417 RepID=A0ABP0G9S9_CLALP